MSKLKLDNSKNNGMLVGESLHMKNLCESCIWRGLGSCPSPRSTAEEDWHDFPQIIEGKNTAGIIKVLKCTDYSPKATKKLSKSNTKFIYVRENGKLILKKIKK